MVYLEHMFHISLHRIRAQSLLKSSYANTTITGMRNNDAIFTMVLHYSTGDRLSNRSIHCTHYDGNVPHYV